MLSSSESGLDTLMLINAYLLEFQIYPTYIERYTEIINKLTFKMNSTCAIPPLKSFDKKKQAYLRMLNPNELILTLL